MGKNTDTTIYAKDKSCIICGEQAVTFWPVIDPDLPHHPYCRKCCDKAKYKALLEMFEPNRKSSGSSVKS